jgi:NTE family protein
MFNLEDVLGQFPIFSSLSKKGLKDLVAISNSKELKKGDIIYKEKEPADSLYVLLAGRIKTYTESSLKENKVLEYLYKGTCFGIISAVTGQPHSVTAEAANDSLLIQIPKNEFNILLTHHPIFAIEFSRLLSRRVKKRIDKDKTIFESCVISVYSNRQRIGKTSYSLMLAKALEQESGKKIILIEIKDSRAGFFFGSSDKVLDIALLRESNLDTFIESKWGFDYLRVFCRLEPVDTSKAIPRLFSLLTESYNFIILDLPAAEGGLITTALVQSDAIHALFYREPGYDQQIEKTIASLKKSFAVKEENIKIIVQETVGQEPKTYYSRLTSSNRQIFATLPHFVASSVSEVADTYPNNVYTQVLRRIARKLAGVRVGLALGSGAAFGVAHVGVLKVLEENSADVDIVSGTSMGSIIAALWGLGYNWEKIKEMLGRFKRFPVFSFFDLGLSKKSFLKGRNLKLILRILFGNTTFYDLKRPILITSFDFIKRQAHIFSQGNLLIRDVVLASCSMPGIFEPLKNQEELFLDGGVLNPLPVGCLVQEGVKKIISINVTPSKESIQKAYAEISKQKKLNVLDFIFGSIEAMQQEFIQSAISLSDIVIHPEFKDALWTDFTKLDYYIGEGEREALKYIEAIKRLQKA